MADPTAQERPAGAVATGGAAFWLASAIGGGIVAFGLGGLLRDAADTVPVSWATFMLGGLVAHDALLAPLVGLLGLALGRVVPATVRPVLQSAAVVSGVVALVALPALGGFGRNGGNPSILPGDYSAGLALVLAVVWTLAVPLAIAAALRARAREDRARR